MSLLSFPKLQLILDYKHFYGVEPPADRFSIIKDISKKNLLFELCALNYRLKPKNALHNDTSLDTQIRELKYFCHNEEVYLKHAKVAEENTIDKNNYPIIFNRQACLFAIEEILNSSKIELNDNSHGMERKDWESILKYYLAVNYQVTQIKNEEDELDVSFETLSPKLLPLNELFIDTDPFFIPYRGYMLIEYFLNKSEVSDELKNYFREAYDSEPDELIFHILGMYLSKKKEISHYDFFYRLEEGKEFLFERLSKRIVCTETYKLINLRKFPFIKVGRLEYLIADNIFLIEKLYSQLINDFWFDRIKNIKANTNKRNFSVKYYRGEIGAFFESYISMLLKGSFENYKYSKLFLFNELKVATGKGEIEIADVYLRYNKKILVAQVKSGSIYDKEKYGGDVKAFYKNDRDEFFKNLGVNQIVQSIENLNTYINKIDKKFPKGHSLQIFPCLIVNDKALQTPFIANTFNDRFQEIAANIDIKKVIINPLTIIHVSDLEKLEEFLRELPDEIWNFLKYNFRNNKFIPPFYDTINKKYNPRKYPRRIFDLYSNLIKKYNPKEWKEESNFPA